MSRKKRKKRKGRARPRDAHPFKAYFELDDYELEPRAAYDEDPFVEEAPDPSRGHRFDFERWRDDLIERGRNRQRMRQRDLKRGVLRIMDIPSHPVDLELTDLDDDDF